MLRIMKHQYWFTIDEDENFNFLLISQLKEYFIESTFTILDIIRSF